jgi:hypothetical protein
LLSGEVEKIVSPEADRILGVFRDRGLRSGALIHPADFGDVIVWEGGFVRDEPVRRALAGLFENGYLIEYLAAFELTQLGEKHIYSGEAPSATT